MIQKTFNEKGYEVSRGFRNTTVYRAAPCDLLLVINPINLKETIEEFRNSEFAYYSGIRVENIYDLGFLAEFQSLLYLEVVSEKPINVAPIESLHNIRGLHVTELKNGLDFMNFPHLEIFLGKWHEKNQNLESCRDLRSIFINNYNSKTKDFCELKNIVRLENLHIIRSNIESLKGIETLKDLKKLMIAYAPKLKDIYDIGKANLREIEFAKTRKIEDYHLFGNIEYLRKIILDNCADIKDIKWISNLRNLDFFSFVETNIVDGDLNPLLDLPELRYVGYLNKKHYNFRMEEINDRLLGVHSKNHSS
ncbi:MAG: hypothetical protein H7Y18_12890 [Clostridiaceae bacterium]|nr:hypothetical protein [Clostridiaceae bacterium]